MSYRATIFLVVVTVAAIATAIYETYYPVETALSVALELVFFVVFFVDLVFDIIRSNYLLDYLLSWPFFYDVTACISILTLAFPNSPWLTFFRFFRVFKLLEVLRLRRSWAVEAGIQRGAMNREAVAKFETSSVSYSVARLVVSVMCDVRRALRYILSAASYFNPFQHKTRSYRLTFWRFSSSALPRYIPSPHNYPTRSPMPTRTTKPFRLETRCTFVS